MTEPRKAGKLGMIPKPLPEDLGMLASYMTNPLGTPPASLTWPAAMSSCGMLGNDRFGDCTWAGAVHLRMLCAAIAGEVETFPTDSDTINGYLAFTHGQDSGCVEADVLKLWQTKGMFGNKLAGFAPLDIGDTDELKAATALFGGTYIGIKVPANASAQFEAHQAWHLDDTSADDNYEGGHCVVKCGYYLDSVWGKVWAVLTWGAVQLVTEEWMAKNLLEDWAVLTDEFIDARPGLIDVAALQADLAKLAA